MQKKRPVTIKDIAKKFKCSPSTVSRALNNHTSINMDTRLNIQEYADKVGYQKNKTALNFLNSKSFTVGVIVPSITSYFNAAIIDGMQKVLDPIGYAMNIFQTKENYAAEVNIFEKLLTNNADGIFVSVSSETKDFSHFEKALKRKIPLILFDRESEFMTHKVCIDHRLSAKIAVQHLIDMGCRRIAHLKGPQELSVSISRFKGYLDAHKENNLPVDEALIQEAGFRGIKGVFPMRKLLALKEHPDGVFAANDNIAVAAMHTIQQHGLRIPDDIAVIGFDNEPNTAFFNPSLSTVFQPTLALGEEVAHIFLNEINQKNEEQNSFQHIVLPTQLIIRDSTLKKAPR